ncbi:MAG: hypothetical protein ACLUJC_06675 [Clostridia bacterium]
MKRKDKQNKKRRNNDLVEVSVNVDVSKIVRNAAIAGVFIVGIVFGCSTYRKMLEWQRDDK